MNTNFEKILSAVVNDRYYLSDLILYWNTIKNCNGRMLESINKSFTK
jgi:hypothetical protein